MKHGYNYVTYKQQKAIHIMYIVDTHILLFIHSTDIGWCKICTIIRILRFHYKTHRCMVMLL